MEQAPRVRERELEEAKGDVPLKVEHPHHGVTVIWEIAGARDREPAGVPVGAWGKEKVPGKAGAIVN